MHWPITGFRITFEQDGQKMENSLVQISNYDFAFLSEMVLEMWCRGVHDELLMELNRKLGSALVVSEFDFPPDVVTLNSRICIEDIQTMQETVYTLVVDDTQDKKSCAVPIMSRLGISLIGQVVGSLIQLNQTEQIRQLRISRLLFQPEVEFNQYCMHMKSIFT